MLTTTLGPPPPSCYGGQCHRIHLAIISQQQSASASYGRGRDRSHNFLGSPGPVEPVCVEMWSKAQFNLFIDLLIDSFIH